MNPYSLLSYDMAKIHRNEYYQKILGILSDYQPRTREAISQITDIRLQTVCGRVNELMSVQILIPSGEGKTSSGHKAEKVTINRLLT